MIVRNSLSYLDIIDTWRKPIEPHRLFRAQMPSERANNEIEKHFFHRDLNGILIYMQCYERSRPRFSGFVIKYFIYGLLIAKHKTIAVMCYWRVKGGKAAEKSAKLDEIYWFLTDKIYAHRLKCEWRTGSGFIGQWDEWGGLGVSAKVYEMSGIRSLRDLYSTHSRYGGFYGNTKIKNVGKIFCLLFIMLSRVV